METKNKSNLFVLIVFLFLIIFPKGGLKIQEIPITWGYLLLPLCTLVNWRFRSLRPLHYLIPLQLLFFYSVIVNGVEDVGFFFDFLYSFFLLPLCIFSADLPILQPKWIRNSMLFLAIYGIVLFFFKLFTGEFFEIPFLTVNGADAGLIGDKCIERGDYFKLISTYQNGNLFGICMLMLLPLYKFRGKSIIKLALLLTLSRTVWAGLIYYELVVEKNYYKVLVIGALLFALSLWMGFSFDFFLDETLGGRSDDFDILREMTLFPSKPFGAIKEMVYVGMMENLGLLGLFAFLYAMIPFAKGRNGQLVYLFLCFSDGALLLIPTMAIYWLLAKKSMESIESPEVDKTCAKRLKIEPTTPL